MDTSHYWSGDLAVSATGDLQIADGSDETRQRILRRLLTNIGDYLWQPAYGAGLPAYVGRAVDYATLSGLIKAQMYLEAGVSHSPEPQVGFTPIPNGIFVRIQYTDADTGQPATLSFDATS